jgi:hypothetical protein
MISRALPRFLPAAVAAAMFAASIARGATQPTPQATLTFGDATAPPGGEAVLPLTLSAAEGVAIGVLDIRVTYPAAELTFAKVEPSGLVLAVEADVRAEVTAGPRAGVSILQARIATPDNGKKPLSPGVLAYFRFAIDKSAKAETSLTLTQTAEALTAGDPARPIAPLSTPDAKVEVVRPPVTACFFYMH